jgi:hypothetical protein
MADDEKDPAEFVAPDRGFKVDGRQGSPTITVAFPFSSVHVEANDGTIDAIAKLAGVVAEVAEAAGRPAGRPRTVELDRLAAVARELQQTLGSAGTDGS